MMNTRLILLLLSLATGILRAQSTNGTLIPFQGRLTDQQGVPRTNGTYTLIFNLYDSAVGGSNIWTERHERVGVVNGMVNVFLGSITSLDGQAPGVPGVDFSSTRYLGITVDADNNSNTSDPEMVPRQMIIPAFWAKDSEKLAGKNWSSILVSGNNPDVGFIRGSKLQPNGVGAAQLAPGSVTASAIGASAVMFRNMARRSESIAPSEAPAGSLAFSAPIQLDAPVTATWNVAVGSTVILTNAGGPMLATLAPIRSASENEKAYVSIKNTKVTTAHKMGIMIGLFEDGQLICNTQLTYATEGMGTEELIIPSGFTMLLFATPGRHEYQIRVRNSSPDITATEVSIRGRLALIEL
jgi:hypothetical protein